MFLESFNKKKKKKKKNNLSPALFDIHENWKVDEPFFFRKWSIDRRNIRAIADGTYSHKYLSSRYQ